MLHIEDLHVSIGDKEVLNGINLHIGEGETFILFGPNGGGKTTLLMTLMGFSNYKVTAGRITFRGQDITHATTFERARLGIGMSFQRPPTIHGLKTGLLVNMCARGREIDVEDLARKVNFDRFLERDVNAGFSGGEGALSAFLESLEDEVRLPVFGGEHPRHNVGLAGLPRMQHEAGGLPYFHLIVRSLKS